MKENPYKYIVEQYCKYVLFDDYIKSSRKYEELTKLKRLLQDDDNYKDYQKMLDGTLDSIIKKD